jgi:iron complex transport system substrate-binding protein
MRSQHANKICIVSFAALVATGLAVPVSAAPPQRIVSINICGDLLALTLAPRARIASVTFLAANPMMSPIAAAAEGVPLNYGKAEEVLAFEPDLVIAGRYTTRATVALLERLGYPVIELDIARSLDDVRSQIRMAALAMGVEQAGEAMIAKLDARISRTVSERGKIRPLAAVYGPNGFTPGAHTLSGSLITLAGFENLATQAGIQTWGSLTLEQLLVGRPDVIIFEAEQPRAPALANQILAHPALADLRARVTVAEVPRPLWSCPGPWIGEALDQLSVARAAAGRRLLH